MADENHDGLFPALLIPMNPDYTVDVDALVGHINHVIANGCTGGCIFGTTGEAATFSVQEKKDILKALIEKGVPSKRLIVGVGCSSAPDTVEMIREALKYNTLSVLWNPPYYYKGVPDEGVIQFYSDCLDQIEDKSNLKVILYNFPANTCVPITHRIVRELYEKYPDNIFGIKDSSFDYEYSLSLIKAFPQIKLYVGKDTDISELIRNGACGAIIAYANLVPRLMRSLYDYGKDDTLPNRNDDLQKLWDMAWSGGKYHWISIYKAIKAGQIGRENGGEKWILTRPPLAPLKFDEAEELVRKMAELNITI